MTGTIVAFDVGGTHLRSARYEPGDGRGDGVVSRPHWWTPW